MVSCKRCGAPRAGRWDESAQGFVCRGTCRVRLFVRLPASTTVEEALDHAQRLGGRVVRLHDTPSVGVVGSVELELVQQEEVRR